MLTTAVLDSKFAAELRCGGT